jgi:hypothetical protein
MKATRGEERTWETTEMMTRAEAQWKNRKDN